MRPEVNALLYDMQQACRLIVQFTEGKNFDEYVGDIACRSAVERQFIVLGEALNRLRKTEPEIEDGIPSQREIISFRNILVHGYDRVEDEVVWGIIRIYLPGLQQRIDLLLSDVTES